MKFIVSLILLFIQSGIAYSQNPFVVSMEPDSVLVRVHNKLSSLKNIGYNSMRELNYSSENYHNTSKWAVYYDFQTSDTMVGLKYQIEDSALKQVFNGTEKFDLDKKNKTIQVNVHPDKKSFNSLSAFYNSIITLRNVLPLCIDDKTAIKTITDTIINSNLYSLVTINIGKRRIQNLGKDFEAMTTKSNFIYKIIIDKNSYLPVEVLQQNDLNNDFIKTSFSNIEPRTNAPFEMSWYYSSYLDEFKPAAGLPGRQLLSTGSLSPEWKLQAYNDAKVISLADFRGKVVLLDFWIKNCGPCIQSVPHLNDLQNKFKNKNFKIISINSYDSKEEVGWFCDKHETNYTVLLNGKSVAEQYGVNGFPTFFIIDKTGKIIYSNVGYNPSIQSEIEQAIKNAL